MMVNSEDIIDCVLFSINGFLGLAFFVMFIPVFKMRQNYAGNTAFSQSLRIYLLLTAPIITVIPAGSVGLCVYFYTNDDKFDIPHSGFRLATFIAGTCYRVYLLIYFLDRIIATWLPEFYGDHFTGKKTGIFMMILGTAIAFCLSIPVVISDVYYVVLNVSAFWIHVLSVIAGFALYWKNKKVNKILAFQPNLAQRYQIIQNIRMFTSAGPYLLIMSIVGPVGPFIASIISFVDPGCIYYIPVFYIFYNLSLVICFLIYILKYWNCQIQELKPTRVIHSVKTVFGKQLPANVTIDGYFETLKSQWK